MTRSQPIRPCRPSLWPAVGRVLFPCALLATMAFIFSNSAAVAEASNQASDTAQLALHTLLDRLSLSGLKALLTVRAVRKLAHFAEYALLGFWWALCLWVYARQPMRRLGWAAAACLLTAFTDEAIQYCTPGRSAQLSDVGLDFAGALCGLGGTLAVLWLGHKLYLCVKYRDKE